MKRSSFKMYTYCDTSDGLRLICLVPRFTLCSLTRCWEHGIQDCTHTLIFFDLVFWHRILLTVLVRSSFTKAGIAALILENMSGAREGASRMGMTVLNE